MSSSDVQLAAAQRRDRLYHLTPERFVLGLLAMEGFLLLSERFQWFTFNKTKGLAVTITSASLGVATVLLILWFALSLMIRLRFQFGIRTLLFMFLVVAVPCGWLATETQQSRKQAVVVAAVLKAGGHVHMIINLMQPIGWLMKWCRRGLSGFGSSWVIPSLLMWLKRTA